jgi:glutamate-1-semialdehyde aminotransferase
MKPPLSPSRFISNVIMKPCIQLTDADLALARSLGDFVPAEIYDIHTHPWNATHFPDTRYTWLADHPLLGCREHRAAIERIVPGRKIHGLYFGYPEPKADRVAINAWVADEVRRNGTPISRALALVSPKDDPAATLELLRRENFVGIKVYHLYAEREDTFNAELEEYAPEWMWEVCHEIGGIIMLHIVRDRAIADEGNLAAIRRLCRKYPKCRLVLAHVARSFNYRNGYEALLCLREACEECGLNSGDVNDIFLNNSLRLLTPHLPVADVPAPQHGPDLWSSAKSKISCGTGLMSKRAELFDPVSWPAYFSRCSGCEVWDLEGRRYVDFAGGVGAILLGYADPDVTRAVRRRLNAGTYCTLVSPDEVELADLLLELHPWAGRVRYARGGGEAMAMAVRIARAATGRSGIAFCGYHGWQDWYLAANLGDSSTLDGHLLPGLQPLGVPRELQGTSVPFRYNDWPSFEAALQQLDGKLAAVVMEPMRSQLPKDNFLEKVAQRCRAAGGVYVVDEITSGWRFGFPGAMAGLGVQPDMAVYAKAMSNGFPCAAVVGKAEIMDAANPSFISSSYWTEGVGTAAALACVRKLRAQNVQAAVWQLGEHLQRRLEELAKKYPLLQFKVGGMPCSPSLAFDLGSASAAAKVLMIRKMLACGYLMSGQLYVMHAHSREKVEAMISSMDQALGEIEALNDSQRLEAEAGPLMSAREFDRIVIEMGGRPTTSEESRLFREAIARTDAKIARQLAPA